MSESHDEQPNLRLRPLTRRSALASAAALALGPLLGGSRPAHAQHHGAHGNTPEPAPPPAPRPRPQPRQGGASRRTPELPWTATERAVHPPGEPGRDYQPVYVPNGSTLPYRVIDGVKVFHLVTEPIVHDLADGLTVKCWGFNGSTPGPVIEAVEGDRVRIYVTNRLPAPTSVHWHGLLVPSGMDGVPGLQQDAIMPGETFRYEFVLPQHGTYMYHPHFEDMTEKALGLTGMFVIHPREPRGRQPDRQFAIMVHEWMVVGGTSRPDPNEMLDFNVLTMNGRAFPDTHPLVARRGDLVRIRLGNLSQMNHHPIHIHGHAFQVVATDGGIIPPAGRWPETTVLVPVGSTRDVELVADNPGDWPFHCHMAHHMMNQMGHGLPNMIGVRVPAELEARIRRLLPGYMTMGQAGMGDMTLMGGMPIPENSIPMKGLVGPYGPTVFGGMATLFKVRDEAHGFEDPGWYDAPASTISVLARPEELARDGIEPPEPADEPSPWRLDGAPGHSGHGGHGGHTTED